MVQSRTDIAAQFISTLPHAQALGLSLSRIGFGDAEIQLPYDTALIGDLETGVIHGGAVSALMDTCCGAAVMGHPDAGVATATIDLRIDYMRAAVPKTTIVAVAECFHMTSSVAFVRATAHDGTSQTPVATATGTFAVERAT
ncbi:MULTISPECIES: PaaI family thioesterase [Pacificibacter]|uniref:PaaI family thioesterase n=1 Tax=Pacificibacter TaxID=1042323 RepID=UPI001C09FF5D|nr:MULTISPECIES: PaaI family thioesterase [Pacificibacter]MBU2935903.1 PaaI family thioesterase [Pacificibacter marinus]MDO6614398.1 PaaI family thioesterase [Pacificibacter sp. 1_MG-2023]